MFSPWAKISIVFAMGALLSELAIGFEIFWASLVLHNVPYLGENIWGGINPKNFPNRCISPLLAWTIFVVLDWASLLP